MGAALYDASREAHTLVAETSAAADAAPVSTRHSTLAELTVPLRGMRRSRKSAIAALALAACASLLVWRGNGPELQQANASTNTAEVGHVCPPDTASTATPDEEKEETDPAMADAPGRVPVTVRLAPRAAATTVVIPSNSEAARLIDGDPANLSSGVQGILATSPAGSPTP
jgi:hypothetical protein